MDHYDNLSKRQAVILEYTLENEKLLPKDFEKLCAKMGRIGKKEKDKMPAKINRRTFQRDLKEMIDKKILKTEGATNQKSYYLREGF